MEKQTPRNAGRLYALAYAQLGQFLNVPAGPRAQMVDSREQWREILGAHVQLVLVKLPRGATLDNYGELRPDWSRRGAAQFDNRWCAAGRERAAMERRRIARTTAYLEAACTLRQRIMDRRARRADDALQAMHDAQRRAAGLPVWSDEAAR